MQQADNTLSCEHRSGKDAVKISFFGGLSLGQINPPQRSEDNGIANASLLDLFGTKCATVAQRNESKDYQDIHALLKQAKFTLAEGIAAARAIYGGQYNPLLTLQALVYFDDLTLPLASGIKTDLIGAVKSVALDKLPKFSAPGKIGECGSVR